MHDYHDATLLTASVTWETGMTILTFKLCSEPEQKVSLVIRDTIFLNGHVGSLGANRFPLME